jgi:hypothetical protein
MKKCILTMLLLVLVVAGTPALATVVLEDGEGTSAQLDARYTSSGDNALRVAQMTTEEPAVSVPLGSGSAKYVFEVGGSPYRGAWKHQFGSSQDYSDYVDEALDFEFYYRTSDAATPGNGIEWFNTADRAEGRAQATLYFDLVDDVGNYIYFTLQLVNDVSPGEAQLGHVNLEAWNSVHIELASGGFQPIGSTISGDQIDASNWNTSTNMSTLTQRQHFWENIVAYTFQESGAGGPGVEGWFGIDDVKLVPEPATMALLGLGGLFLSSRKRK